MSLLAGLRRRLSVWLDPVCQDPDALLYTHYKGVAVRLVPVYNGDRIDQWIPDPLVTALLDSAQQPPTTQATPAQPAPPLPPLP